ncbi:MAG: protein-methionine-sulfoxide reductase catalytic subunit MsrP [Gammaproteobacteria bacterium]|nr:protein-methionine-sulfoxide reductase catalytic subunit MsrP [Gammaproteobacteria bacterium]MDE0251752.1 protein-methionine-sulfoxide reductase catalytic subunit MsrP [Gammaproteobacteria bacterium]MDE0403239.1 protein-methionine-sulfoxide reductase catalytic subunit MsrP [Gammaproteobacteria bacterium]
MILIKSKSDILSSEITPEAIYKSRRKFIGQSAALAALGCMYPSVASALPTGWVDDQGYEPAEPTDEEITPEKTATTYNNFYEFGTNKGDPSKHAHRLTTDPWTVQVGGMVQKPKDFALEDLLKDIDLEERIYRLRCVEAWSMVIPWIGFPVKKILDKVEPLGDAKYVKFTTVLRKNEMRGTFASSIDFPYVEGLRLDEANHPLAIFAVGMYGKILPNQNGAPFRLVVPWKYGFKSIKSIVKIELVKREPRTTWNKSAPHEYGFYSNVNPHVNHPRWSQATERRLPSGLIPRKIETKLFNGYDEVASLYEGMDLKKHF